MVYYGCHSSVSSFKTKKKEKSAYRQEVVFLWSQTQQQFGAGTFWPQAAGVGDGAVFRPVLLRREPHHPGQNTHVSLRVTLQIGLKKKRRLLKDFLQLLHLRVTLEERPAREERQESSSREPFTSIKLTSAGRAQRRCSRRSTRPQRTCRRSWAAPPELCTTASPPERSGSQVTTTTPGRWWRPDLRRGSERCCSCRCAPGRSLRSSPPHGCSRGCSPASGRGAPPGWCAGIPARSAAVAWYPATTAEFQQLSEGQNLDFNPLKKTTQMHVWTVGLRAGF